MNQSMREFTGYIRACTKLYSHHKINDNLLEHVETTILIYIRTRLFENTN